MIDEETPSAFFPRSYITGLFRFIHECGAKIECITYRDFYWEDDVAYETGYLDEWERWRGALKSGLRDPQKIYLLVQYDVDARPERTMALLGDPLHRGIPASIMVFGRRHNRALLAEKRTLEFTDYHLDDELLREREKSGSVVGYHINAFEHALWNKERALEILEEDVNGLRRRFNIEFCSAHGGVPDAEGNNNHSIRIPGAMRPSLRWVHNKYSPRFNGQYSDGGHLKSKINPAKRDIRDFVKTWQPGGRYRILLHPQYYDVEFVPSPSHSGTPWYDEMIATLGAADTNAANAGYALTPPEVLAAIAKERAKARKGAGTVRRPAPAPKPIPPPPTLKTRVSRRAYVALARLRMPVAPAGQAYDGEVLLHTAPQHGSKPVVPAVLNVLNGGTPGRYNFPDAGSTGHVLLGGGFWSGAFCYGFYRSKGLGAFTDGGDGQTLPWGGWPTSKGWRYRLQVDTSGDSLPLKLRAICLSYDRDGRLIAQSDICVLSERIPRFNTTFLPHGNAAAFNVAIYKANDQPAGAVTFNTIKLTRETKPQ